MFLANVPWMAVVRFRPRPSARLGFADVWAYTRFWSQGGGVTCGWIPRASGLGTKTDLVSAEPAAFEADIAVLAPKHRSPSPLIVNLAIGFGFVSAAALALAAAGFSLQFGITNIFNLAYGTVMTVGMYTAYTVNVMGGQSIWLGLLSAAAAGAVLSWLMNTYLFTPLIRKGVSLWAVTIVTFAAGIIVGSTLLAVAGTRYKTYRQPVYRAHHFLGVELSTLQLEIIGLAVLILTGLHLLLRYSRLGKQMRATAANPDLARTSGIATAQVTGAAWLLSGALCGVAGVLEALDLTTFTSLTGDTLLLVVVAAAIFGGIGQAYGAMLGALVIGMATELAAVASPSLKNVIAFAILAATLLIRPNGLLPSPTISLTGTS